MWEYLCDAQQPFISPSFSASRGIRSLSVNHVFVPLWGWLVRVDLKSAKLKRIGNIASPTAHSFLSGERKELINCFVIQRRKIRFTYYRNRLVKDAELPQRDKLYAIYDQWGGWEEIGDRPSSVRSTCQIFRSLMFDGTGDGNRLAPAESFVWRLMNRFNVYISDVSTFRHSHPIALLLDRFCTWQLARKIIARIFDRLLC